MQSHLGTNTESLFFSAQHEINVFFDCALFVVVDQYETSKLWLKYKVQKLYIFFEQKWLIKLNQLWGTDLRYSGLVKKKTCMKTTKVYISHYTRPQATYNTYKHYQTRYWTSEVNVK